ncbi:MAG: nitroreductase family protein [Nitrospinota bacterium]|nr:nitroreductase family protein [Nitrospinota bacterium]
MVRRRHTSRKFKDEVIPREVFEQVVEAGRHACSGANSQPWEYIVVEDPKLKEQIGEYFIQEARARAKLKMGFPTPNYSGMKTAPGLIVALVDYRYVNAFPVLNDGSDLDRMYQENAQRIRLQSLAASVMSMHLAAAALGYSSVGHGHRPGEGPEGPEADPGRSRSPSRHRHSLFRPSGEGALRPSKEAAGGNPPLGALRSLA